MSSVMLCPYCGSNIRINTKRSGAGKSLYTKQAACTMYECDAKGPMASTSDEARKKFGISERDLNWP